MTIAPIMPIMPIMTLPPLSAYIHWPYCATICPYCDFNVYRQKDIDGDLWLGAFQAEIKFIAGKIDKKRVLHSIYFGGGTPSLMPHHILSGILDALATHFGVAPDCEISLEANPDHLHVKDLRALAACGVTRLSLGVQSLDDAALKWLGRTHNAATAMRIFKNAQTIFPAVSLDLIYARPEQSPMAWEAELTQALGLDPAHLSAYQLSIEPRTRFFKNHQAGRFQMPDEIMQSELFTLTHNLCEAGGLPAYEISNFARADKYCRHNVNLWQGGDYMGLGAGAHGRLYFEEAEQKSAEQKSRPRYASYAYPRPADWLAAIKRDGHGLKSIELQSQTEQIEERVLFGTRLKNGVSLNELKKLGFTPKADTLALLTTEGLIEDDKNYIRPTMKGRLVLDAVSAALLLA